MRVKYIKARQNRKTTHHRWLFVLLFGILIVAGVTIKQLFFSNVFAFFHGPHLSKALYKSGLNPQDVLGSRTNRFNFRFRNTSTPTPTKKPTPTPTKKPTPTPTPIPIITTKHNLYGIAAGGSLPSFDQTTLDLYFSKLKELGISWVRYDFEWRQIQRNGAGTFDWSGTDRVVQAATKYGISTLGTIAYAPTWAQQPACKGSFACAPDDPNAFGIFAGQVVSHYAPKGIHHWEIWNEPNIPVFWKPTPNVSSYVAILKSAYSNIKSVDPSAFVLTAGLSIAGNENNNISPITFIQSLYASDTTKDFDGIAIHPYSYPVLASYPASWNFWQQIGTIRQLMATNGDATKPLWITEYGAPTGGQGSAHDISQMNNFTWGSDYMTEDAQATMMRDTISLYSSLQTPVGPLFWYSLRDNGTSRDTPENFFGLVRYDWSKKPAYDILHNAILAGQ
jgi:polysaccharide biosynthesis protein PslG